MCCDICKKQFEQLYNCGACLGGLYCSVECQTKDYRNHSLICGSDPEVVANEIVKLAEQCNMGSIDLMDKSMRELSILLRRLRRRLRKINKLRRHIKRYLALLDADSVDNVKVVYSLKVDALKKYAIQLKQSIDKRKQEEK